jgi:hypothetical protein
MRDLTFTSHDSAVHPLPIETTRLGWQSVPEPSAQFDFIARHGGLVVISGFPDQRRGCVDLARLPPSWLREASKNSHDRWSNQIGHRRPNHPVAVRAHTTQCGT